MGEVKLERCPVCERLPKVRYSYYGDFVAVRVECKPWYCRKPHLKTEVASPLESVAEERAREAWNAKADCANLPAW